MLTVIGKVHIMSDAPGAGEAGGAFWASRQAGRHGYWRGPIWAPSTMILLDGLWECGEKDLVKDIAGRFCRMVEKSGCAENFDAQTGEGLRDRAYTWTASAMLVMAEEYLNT